MADRVALYSHDTIGLGHIRRNLLIAQVLTERNEQRAVLLISGTRTATHFELPARVDCVTLPGLKKQADGQYAPRRLALDLHAVTHLRSSTTKAAVQAFDPDLLIVDNVPGGANKELVHSLAWARRRGTRIVLGLRDVLDEPATVRREWQCAGNEHIIRNYYSEVWVYGDPAVYDVARECQFPAAVVSKLRYTGYLNQRRRLERADRPPEPADIDVASPPFAVCLVGGGEDGAHLAHAFANARAPGNALRVLVTGPFMAEDDRRNLDRLAEQDPALKIAGFVDEPGRLIEQAACVVAMGGYNTTCDILSFNKRALIMPRVRPRLEQWIRAKRLEELGRVDVLSPESLTPARVTQWLGQNFGRPVPAGAPIDLDGLYRVVRFADQQSRNGRPRQVISRSVDDVA